VLASSSEARPPLQASWLAADSPEMGGSMVRRQLRLQEVAFWRWWGVSSRWRRLRRRRGPTSPGKGGASEAHGKTAEGRPRAELAREVESMGVLVQDPNMAVVLRPARADKRQGGRGGCSRCAPCEEKGGTGEIFWPGGSRCLFNSAIVWSSGGGMEAVPRSGTWGGDPTQRG
jgi:hypothetical protein